MQSKKYAILGRGGSKFDTKRDRNETDLNEKYTLPRKNEAAKLLTQPCNPRPQIINSFPEFTRLPAIYLASV